MQNMNFWGNNIKEREYKSHERKMINVSSSFNQT